MPPKQKSSNLESVSDTLPVFRASPVLLPVPFAELHNPLFLAGKNHGTKLDPIKDNKLTLQYVWDKKILLVGYNGKLGVVPDSNIASITLGSADIISQILGVEILIPESTYQKPMVVTAGSAPMTTNVSRTAQVADPTRGSFT